MPLSACSDVVQDRLADDWAPVYPVPAIETTRQMPTGAIYSETAPGLFAADRRAAQVGDILTVDFTERFSGRDVQGASMSRSDESSINLPGGHFGPRINDSRPDHGRRAQLFGQRQCRRNPIR